MATKKTKNAKNAAEYIDSAGVKLNANSDLIIEANKDGDVISARNLLNNTEYVGSSGGGAFVVNITAVDGETTIDKSYAEILSAHQAGSIIFAQIQSENLSYGYCTAILTFYEEEDQFKSYYSTFGLVDEGEGTLVPTPIYVYAVVYVDAGETHANITIQ